MCVNVWWRCQVFIFMARHLYYTFHYFNKENLIVSFKNRGCTTSSDATLRSNSPLRDATNQHCPRIESVLITPRVCVFVCCTGSTAVQASVWCAPKRRCCSTSGTTWRFTATDGTPGYSSTVGNTSRGARRWGRRRGGMIHGSFLPHSTLPSVVVVILGCIGTWLGEWLQLQRLLDYISFIFTHIFL